MGERLRCNVDLFETITEAMSKPIADQVPALLEARDRMERAARVGNPDVSYKCEICGEVHRVAKMDLPTFYICPACSVGNR